MVLGTHTPIGECVGQSGCPFVELRVGQAEVAAHEGPTLGHSVGDRFEQVREIPLHGRSLGVS
jgi:hypothetical protein